MRTDAARNGTRPMTRMPTGFSEPDVALLVAVPLIAFVVAGLFAAGRALLPDEAAFLLNFSIGWRDLLRPLWLYDQAAPPLAVVTLTGLDALAAGSLRGMRLLLLALSMAGLIGLAVFAVVRRNPLLALALALFVSAQPVIIYATEIKPYILDGGLALALLAVYLDHARQPTPVHLPAFCLLALVAFGLAFSSAFVLGAILVDLVLRGWRRPDGRAWIAALVGLCLLWAVLYVVVFQPILAVHLANNSKTYEETQLRSLVQGSGAGWRVLRALAGCVPYLAIPALMAAVLFATIRRRREAVAPAAAGADIACALRLLAIIAVLLAGLSLGGLYPLSSTHQLLYLAPFVCFALAALTLRFAWGLPARTLALALAVCLVPVSILNVTAAARTRFERTDTAGLIGFIQKSGTPQVAAWITFEPVLRYYEETMALPGIAVVARLKAGSGPLLDRDRMVQALQADSDAIPQQAAKLMADRAVANAYANWLAQRLPPEGATLVAGADMSQDDIALLTNALSTHGCTARKVFEGKGVVAIRADCGAARGTGQAPLEPRG